jgi:signal transduction histidine kinase
MNIRTRLALQFMLLASLVLGTAFLAIYSFSARYRTDEFVERMRDRGTNAAMLLIQVDEVNEELLRRIKQDNPMKLPEEAIRIFDHHNDLLFHLGDEHLPPTPPAFLDNVRLSGETVHEGGLREQLAFPFKDRYERFVVVVSGNDIYGRSKLRNLRSILLFTFLAGLVITFFVGRLYARRALKPLNRLVTDLHAIEPSDLTRRVEAGNRRDEVAEVARSFNALMDRLQEAFHVQRNFIANASHEMRTPLTTISGQLEVLLLRDRSGDDYRHALRSVVEDMHALNRLADRLLLLAQAENSTTAATFSPVRMDEVLWHARQEVMRSDRRSQIDVSIDEVEDESDLIVQGNEVLLRSMVGNLMENACKYSPDHRAVVSLSGPGPAVRVAVDNAGTPIAATDQERIFEPFHRGDNTAGASGHGIGLSLVRRIAQLHGGSVKVRSSAQEGTRFTVRLPKAG